MATLATFFKRSEFRTSAATRTDADRTATIRAESDPFRLRALPNDEIYFYSKRVDNGRLVRQADPAASGQCWSAVSAAALLLLIFGSIIAPSVASVLAGYKLEGLKTEHQSLIDRKRELDAREAALLSPERLNELAKEQQLSSPASSQIFHLDNPSMDGHFAKAEVPAHGVLARQ
jgi:hypothetical protein